MGTIAQEYLGSKFTYADTFKMFNDYKKAFLHLEGVSGGSITISSPSTVASVNAFYGAMDANKPVNMVGPGFLHTYTRKYTEEMGSSTVAVFDTFLSSELIQKLHDAHVKNVLIFSASDYMPPQAKEIAMANGLIPKESFLDLYIREHQHFPMGMQFLCISEFAETGAHLPDAGPFPYEEDRIAARFLTGATTSQVPKTVNLYEDGFTKMALIYDNMWFDFMPGDRQTVFIPLFYATGAIHGVHAGLFSGMTLLYKPKYDRFAFASDLLDTRPKMVLVAPSHVATLESAKLPDNALSFLKYIFIGGEAIMPAQMEKFRKTAARLGIQYILNGYGMTETGSMSALSDKTPASLDDVGVRPVPGVSYRIVDPQSGCLLPKNHRGILQKKTPCATAGYMDAGETAQLFTADGWINTGDVAECFDNGSYRIYGRGTDSFENQGKHYPMYDIEEQVLRHPAISEAEVIKFAIHGEEYPAIIMAVREGYGNQLYEIGCAVSSLDVAGMEYLIGMKFVDKFATNPVTGKRDYLSLPLNREGYFTIQAGQAYAVDIGGGKRKISKDEIRIMQ